MNNPYELRQVTMLESEIELLRVKVKELKKQILEMKIKYENYEIPVLNDKTELWKWAYNHKDKLPKNVFNVLVHPKTFDTNTYVEDITWEEFNKYRGLGAKAWEVFDKLRNDPIAKAQNRFLAKCKEFDNRTHNAIMNPNPNSNGIANFITTTDNK